MGGFPSQAVPGWSPPGQPLEVVEFRVGLWEGDLAPQTVTRRSKSRGAGKLP